ncbi:MAG: hypothetical protein ACLP1X_19245, partial [Polyangiaceae bacterium]
MATLALTHFDVVVSEDAAANVQPFAGLDHERLGRALASLLALKLRGVVLRGEDELLCGVVDADFLARRVEDQLHAGVDEVLHEKAGPQHVAAKNYASELEREKTSQRTAEALMVKARKGLNVGGRVFGY